MSYLCYNERMSTEAKNEGDILDELGVKGWRSPHGPKSSKQQHQDNVVGGKEAKDSDSTDEAENYEGFVEHGERAGSLEDTLVGREAEKEFQNRKDGQEQTAQTKEMQEQVAAEQDATMTEETAEEEEVEDLDGGGSEHP